ncbi:MAG: elongation factor G [Clostridia bacterium]|nr:elongation factor G [Clostridia bacterium]
MKDYTTSNIRNIGLVGHGSQGKTILAEAMVYNSGEIDRMGKVENGNTVMDFDPEETKREISISLSMAPVEWNNHKINVIDIPGYFDMVGEMASGLKVSDSAIIVLGATSGLEVGAEKAWDYCEKYSIAKMFFVNAMDKEHANFDKLLEELQSKYGTSVVPIQLPIMEGAAFVGYVDILSGKAYKFDGSKKTEIEVPGALSAKVSELQETLTEAAASSDEKLMEVYFDKGELSKEEIIKGLKSGILEGSLVPVACGSALENKNINSLLDCIVDLMPSPLQAKPYDAMDTKANKEISLECDSSKPVVLFVFKSITDKHVGKINFFRILSGTLKSGDHLYNSSTQKEERIQHVYLMLGKKQIDISELQCGDIGALTKLTNTNTNDTLYDPSWPVKVNEIEFPVPCISYAISSAKEGDEDKVFSGLSKLQEEDPSFVVAKAEDTSDTLISGQGAMHINIVVSKLEAKFHAEAILADPQIAYRETIRKTVEAKGRHKKQSGGHGQFGDVAIRFEPILDGSADFEFVDAIVGGVVPKNYIPAVEKGLRECITKGALAGFPVLNLKCTLFDGSYHPVDSSEMAFKTAAHLAFKKGCLEASPVILEPIYHVSITVPDDYMGDIMGDMSRRRGKILGSSPAGKGQQQVEAEAPQSELFKYATDLRSMTGARGSFIMKFSHYEDLPGNLAQKVIEEAKSEEE